MQSPPSTRLARLAGYAVVLALLGLLAWAGTWVYRETARPDRVIRVRFQEMGTLTLEDPVVENGVGIGKVRDISLVDGQAIVALEIFGHGFIAEDARFVNFSHSPMGARRVLLVPGQSSVALDESRVQEGLFAEGLAETLKRVDDLVQRLSQLRQETERLFASEDSPLSPLAAQKKIGEALQALASLSLRLQEARKPLETAVTGWTAAGKRADQGVRAAGPALDSGWREAESAIRILRDAERKLAPALAGAEALARAAQDTASPAGKLLNDRSAYDDLEKTLELLKKTEKLLEDEGLSNSMRMQLHFRKPPQ